MEWDKVCKDFRLIEKNEDGSEIIYMAIQPPISILSPKDFVQKRKVWKNFQDDDSILFYFKSVTHPSCPVNKKYIRAEAVLSGYYMKTISTSPERTLFYGIVHNDIKGNIPVWVTNHIAPKFPKEWINALKNGCMELKKKHGNSSSNGFNI